MVSSTGCCHQELPRGCQASPQTVPQCQQVLFWWSIILKAAGKIIGFQCWARGLDPAGPGVQGGQHGHRLPACCRWRLRQPPGSVQHHHPEAEHDLVLIPIHQSLHDPSHPRTEAVTVTSFLPAKGVTNRLLKLCLRSWLQNHTT